MNTQLPATATGLLLVLLLPAGTTVGSPYLATIGEGYTAVAAGGTIDISYRKFSAPDAPGYCRQAAAADRLRTAARTITLAVGDRFPLNTLSLTAVDRQGKVLPRIPVTVWAEEPQPPLLDYSRYQAGGDIIAIRPGQMRVRVRGYCWRPGASASEAVIAVTVRER